MPYEGPMGGTSEPVAGASTHVKCRRERDRAVRCTFTHVQPSESESIYEPGLSTERRLNQSSQAGHIGGGKPYDPGPLCSTLLSTPAPVSLSP